NGQPVEINVPDEFAGKLIRYKDVNFIGMRIPFMQIDSVIKNSAAQKAGLQKGDKVISVNGIATYWYNDFAKQIIKSRGKNITLDIDRGGRKLTVAAAIPKDDGLGVANVDIEKILTVKKVTYSF